MASGRVPKTSITFFINYIIFRFKQKPINQLLMVDVRWMMLDGWYFIISTSQALVIWVEIRLESIHFIS